MSKYRLCVSFKSDSDEKSSRRGSKKKRPRLLGPRRSLFHCGVHQKTREMSEAQQARLSPQVFILCRLLGPPDGRGERDESTTRELRVQQGCD